MLQSMRRTVSSWVVRILFGLLIISFAVWGIGDVFRGDGQGQVVAEVGGEPITATALDAAVRQEQNRLSQLLGADFANRDEIRRIAVDTALNSLIEQRLINQAAFEAGLAPTDSMIAEAIVLQEAFQDETGEFNASIFRSALFQSGLSEAEATDLFRAELARSLFVSGFLTLASPPETLGQRLLDVRLQRREISLMILPGDLIDPPPPPDEATLQAFFETRQELYRRPEYRSFLVAYLAPQEIAQTITVDEARIRAAYEEEQDRFGSPATRTFAQIVLGSEAEAEGLFQAAAEAGGLEQGVAALGLAEDVAEIGPVQREDLLEPLAESLFGTGEPGLLQPVQSPLGWHVIELNEATAADIATLEEVRDELARDIALRDAFDVLFDLSQEIDDLIIGGASLREAAEATGTPLVEAGPVAADGSTPGATSLPAFPGAGRAIELAFDMEPEELPQPIEAADGTIVFVTLQEITPSRIPDLEEVRSEVVADWQEVRRAERLAERADELLQELREGRALEPMAEELGLGVRAVPPFTRNNPPAELNPNLVTAIFALEEPGRHIGGPVAGGHALLRLETILEPAETSDLGQAALERQQVAAEILRGYVDDVGRLLVDALAGQIGVEQRPQALAAYRANLLGE